jgi:7,8-dihydro-6-hydroxymethylpterin-pyrophosphokinase
MALADEAASRVPPPHEIIIVPHPKHEDRTFLLQQCIHIRIDVFVTEQGFPLEVEVDEYAAFPEHLHLPSNH